MVSLSFDIGTTNIKSMVTRNQTILDVSTTRLETHQNGIHMTQDPSIILEAIKQRIQHVDETYGLDSCVLVCAMHTLILLDASYQPLEPMLLWSDNRGESIQDPTLQQMLHTYYKTGTPYHPMSPFIKLQTYDPQYLQTCLVADLKSYLMVHLTGEFITDVSSASASGMMNLHTHSWDEKCLKCVSITTTALPEIKDCETIIPTHCFSKVFWVMIGSTDGVMANRGTQTMKRQTVLSVGTSVGMRSLSDVPILDSQGKTFCYVAPHHHYLIGNASNNGGNLYDWIVETLFDGDLPFEDFVAIITESIPHHFATPYVYGERGPFWVKHLRVSFSSQDMTPKEKARAIIYGMFANIYLLKQSMASIGSNDPICLTGGFLKDRRLVQLLADMCEQDVLCVDDENAVCVAAMHLLTKHPIKQTQHLVKHQKNDALVRYREASCAYLYAYVNKRKGV